VLPLDGCNVYAFPGDNHTVAIAIGRHPQDQALSAVRSPAAFDAAVAAVPLLAGFVRPDVTEPVSAVHVMAGIRATFRRMAPQGRPLFHGLIPIGDALATTNPAYGRGLALALTHAEVVTEALGHVGATRTSAAPELAARVLPRLDALTFPVWYDAYRHDGMRIDQWRRTLGLPEVARSESRPWLPLSLAAAGARVDAQVFIRMLRAMQLLDRPDQFFGDLDLIDQLPGMVGAPMPLPTRSDLVAAVEGDPLQAVG